MPIGSMELPAWRAESMKMRSRHFRMRLESRSDISGEKELDICFYKAKAQALDGKTKDALATYNAIIKYNKDARAYYLRGDLYMDMGEEKKRAGQILRVLCSKAKKIMKSTLESMSL